MDDDGKTFGIARAPLPAGRSVAMTPMSGDPVDEFRQALASLRERVGTGPRSPVEEDIQRLSNRRFHLVRDFAKHKPEIEALVAEHHRLSPQLRLRVLGTG